MSRSLSSAGLDVNVHAKDRQRKLSSNPWSSTTNWSMPSFDAREIEAQKSSPNSFNPGSCAAFHHIWATKGSHPRTLCPPAFDPLRKPQERLSILFGGNSETMWQTSSLVKSPGADAIRATEQRRVSPALGHRWPGEAPFMGRCSVAQRLGSAAASSQRGPCSKQFPPKSIRYPKKHCVDLNLLL